MLLDDILQGKCLEKYIPQTLLLSLLRTKCKNVSAGLHDCLMITVCTASKLRFKEPVTLTFVR